MHQNLVRFIAKRGENVRATAINGGFGVTSNGALLPELRYENSEATTLPKANLPEGCQPFGTQILALQ